MTTLVRPGSPPQPDREPEDSDYNLAARIYRSGSVEAGPRADAPRYEAPDYNLAARIYGWNPGRPSPAIKEDDGVAAGTLTFAGASSASAVALPLEGTSANRRGLGRLTNLRTFDSLRIPNFRWYFISMIGVFGAMNMQMLVRGFIVFQLTGSYVALGTIAIANAIPGLVLSLPGGVVADRIPKKIVQQVGNTLNAVNALSIALLLMAGMLRFEHLMVNAIIQGVIQGLMMPARQSMIPDIVLPRYIMNAVALNNVGMNISRMFMPALGGFLLAVTDSYWVFFIMAGFYLFSAVTLIRVPSKPIDIPPEERIASSSRGSHGAPSARGSSKFGAGDLWDGMKYMVRDRTIGLILLVNFLMVLCSMPYMQMLPGFVEQVLKGGPGMQGALMSATSVGSLAAALVIASLPSKHRGAILLLGSALLGFALVAFSASHWLWATLPIMVFIGIGQSTRMALSNVLVQSYADDHYRGRVMSIYMMEMSLVQIGTFFVGLAAEMIGIQWALGLTSATLVVLAMGTFVFVPRMRQLD